MTDSTGEICAFTEDDVCLVPEWLEGMIEVYRQLPGRHRRRPDLFVVAGRRAARLAGPPASIRIWVTWNGATKSSSCSLPKNGSAAATSRSGASYSSRSAPFAPIWAASVAELLATEETEFTERALRHGARMFYAPRMSVKHWVSPPRATVDFIVKCARGSTTGRMRSKNPFGVRQFSRSFFGNSYLVAYYEIGRWLAKLRGNRRAEVTCTVMRESSAAGAAECLRRVLAFRR